MLFEQLPGDDVDALVGALRGKDGGDEEREPSLFWESNSSSRLTDELQKQPGHSLASGVSSSNFFPQ